MEMMEATRETMATVVQLRPVPEPVTVDLPAQAVTREPQVPEQVQVQVTEVLPVVEVLDPVPVTAVVLLLPEEPSTEAVEHLLHPEHTEHANSEFRFSLRVIVSTIFGLMVQCNTLIYFSSRCYLYAIST